MSHRRKNPDRLTEAPPVDLVPLPPAAPPDPPAVPGAFEAAWEHRVQKALDMVDRGIDARRPLGMEPDEYRARMVAVKLVLGVQRSALPLPTRQALKLGELEVKDGDKVIRLRWADGREVKMDLHDPMKREARPDGDDDE